MSKIIWLGCDRARSPVIAFDEKTKMQEWLRNGPTARHDVVWVVVMEEGKFRSTLPVWDVPAFLFDR